MALGAHAHGAALHSGASLATTAGSPQPALCKHSPLVVVVIDVARSHSRRPKRRTTRSRSSAHLAPSSLSTSIPVSRSFRYAVCCSLEICWFDDGLLVCCFDFNSKSCLFLCLFFATFFSFPHKIFVSFCLACPICFACYSFCSCRPAPPATLCARSAPTGGAGAQAALL